MNKIGKVVYQQNFVRYMLGFKLCSLDIFIILVIKMKVRQFLIKEKYFLILIKQLIDVLKVFFVFNR